jgi:hypothetical protein
MMKFWAPRNYKSGSNLFNYVHSNPLRALDPTGYEPCDEPPEIEADDCVMFCVGVGVGPFALCTPQSYPNPGRHQDNQDNCDRENCDTNLYEVGGAYYRGWCFMGNMFCEDGHTRPGCP